MGQLCPSSTGFDNKTGVVGSIEKEFYEALNAHRGRLKRPENAAEEPKWTASRVTKDHHRGRNTWY
jgi:hypothetical protein